MDIYRIIDELGEERERLGRIIESLEVLALGVELPAPVTGKRRGRKFMDESGRKEVSERMKLYWAKRRGGEPPRALEASA